MAAGPTKVGLGGMFRLDEVIALVEAPAVSATCAVAVPAEISSKPQNTIIGKIAIENRNLLPVNGDGVFKLVEDESKRRRSGFRHNM